MAGSEIVDNLLGPGADETQDLRDESRLVADWLWDWASPGYGPRGGTKLIVSGEEDGDLVVTDSPATGLREAGPAHPGVSSYRQLAINQQKAKGDGATTALLLAVVLVRRSLEASGPLMPVLDGLAAARRQCLAVLSANATQCTPETVLASVVPEHPDWPPIVVAGLRQLAEHGKVDLDAIDVRAEPVSSLVWDEGLVLEPDAPHAVTHIKAAKVALVQGVRERATFDTTLTLRSPGQSMDDVRWRALADRLVALGVNLVLSMKALPEDFKGALMDRGILVQQNLTKAMAWRMQLATGAELAPSPDAVSLDELGVADLQKRPARRGGWSLHGPGAAATLCVPQSHGNVHESRVEHMERLLRAAGAALEDSRGVPGAGQWLQALEASVVAMVDHLPGRGQLGARAAARALRDLRQCLVRNAGLDPLDQALPPAPEGLMDGYGAIRDAVDNAFRAADALLRLDGRYQKRGSNPTSLRGGTGPSGSPLGMPGDVPPLM